MRNVIVFTLVLFGGSAAAADRECEPLQQQPANAPQQEPAFAGQTRACEADSGVELDVTVLATGLVHPWAVEPLPNGDLLITERPGRMRIISGDGKQREPLQGIPDVYASGQAGLLDVALSPSFDSDRTIFWSYSEPRGEENGTAVARGVLDAKRNRVSDVDVIFRAKPDYDNNKHYGSRLVFDSDGKLFITLGERSDLETRPQAQQLDSHYGKIVRINPDGSVPDDNPFVDTEDAQPETWTLGHRNVQSAAMDDEGRLWAIEHGPRGGDELNLIEKGTNYGWPIVSYGLEYSGAPVVNAKTQRPGYEQPEYYWDPVIAPSGAEFYSGKLIPEWEGNLLVGALVQHELVRLEIENGKVTGEEHFLGERGQRIRDVREDDDGVLYVVTDESDGELWKVAPAD